MSDKIVPIKRNQAKQVNITVSGLSGSGKSAVLRVIEDALQQINVFPNTFSDDHISYVDARERIQKLQVNGLDVNLIETNCRRRPHGEK